MASKQEEKLSKLFSYVLRHKPESIGITLDSGGWVDIDELISKVNESGTLLTNELLMNVVNSDDKKRYEISDNGISIRACQGHSVNVDLGLKKTVPPVILYHGTADRFIESIMKSGLSKMNRQYVHLSDNLDTARSVGVRHGKLIVLDVDTKMMYKDGYEFYKSTNGVWLTDNVPSKYLNV